MTPPSRARLRGSSLASALSIVAVTLLAALAPTRAQAKLPAESPLYGEPYRSGPGLEVAIGVALCQPGLVFQGRCARGDSDSPALPGLALRLGLGWRLDDHWWVGGGWVRQMHRPAGPFVGGSADGGVVTARGIVILPRRDGRDSAAELGFELGLGLSRRVLLADAAPARLSSFGALVRPAIVLEGWVIADLALGVEIASHINMHWRHCADALCEGAPGPWIGDGLDARFVDGFTVALRATGLIVGLFR
ncbi:hypothetical protein G6O69_34350 [Pseudenhygromyxa sp. WMMC2535]|uniref:hypothetical protein n=1 Tax=Pseudenhygromyxa sp. WMMC2535 TaxID=2712867 RepID=UPI001554BD8A|nr:hypothetical protein [Pseudenhygromyxa sp. WMMC2535]NVB42954.1 hypothetical protein [Pseudenhygromyxa sp. WMMC2535]